MNNDPSKKKPSITVSDIVDCLAVLETIVDRSELLAELSEEQRVALLTAAGRISRPDKKEKKSVKKKWNFFAKNKWLNKAD